MRGLFSFVLVALLFSSCSPRESEAVSAPFPTRPASATAIELSEAAIVATEQVKAAAVKTRSASTMAIQPTFTPGPTWTPTSAHLPTFTPLPNSTPAGTGASFDVSSGVLGSQYEIENACYFDTQSGWERYEIYAGAVAGSGDEYSAQGVAIVRIFRMVAQDGKSHAELVDTTEYLTERKEGPLRLPLWSTCDGGSMLLTTPLNFGWFLTPGSKEFYQYNGIVPFARLSAGEKTQIAHLGGYCWNGGCADGGAIPTSSDPLIVRASEKLHLRLPLLQSPDKVAMSAMLVSPPGVLQPQPGFDGIFEHEISWLYERPGRDIRELGALAPQREQDFSVPLEPGFYVLMVIAVWKDYGDATYGFLIEVRE